MLGVGLDLNASEGPRSSAMSIIDPGARRWSEKVAWFQIHHVDVSSDHGKHRTKDSAGLGASVTITSFPFFSKPLNATNTHLKKKNSLIDLYRSGELIKLPKSRKIKARLKEKSKTPRQQKGGSAEIRAEPRRRRKDAAGR